MITGYIDTEVWHIGNWIEGGDANLYLAYFGLGTTQELYFEREHLAELKRLLASIERKEVSDE
jgi:hypothetical protein